jgi:hypothetical protein
MLRWFARRLYDSTPPMSSGASNKRSSRTIGSSREGMALLITKPAGFAASIADAAGFQ